MRKGFVFIIFCVIGLCSCANRMKVPKKVIQPEKMSLLLWDMMQVQYLAEYNADKDSLINKEIETEVLTEKVFEIHQTTPENFEKSYNWYVKNPHILKVMMDSLQARKNRERFKPEEANESRPEPAGKMKRYKVEREEAVPETSVY